MPKITRFGGMSNAGLTERDAGFIENTDAVKARAAENPQDDSADADKQADAPDVAALKAEAPFNPSSMSVPDVLALRDECTDEEWAAVVEAERADKNRAGIVGK